MTIEIILTASELMVAATVGAMRRIKSLQSGLNKNKHAMKSDWATDIDGAAAEIAVAKHFQIYWGPSIDTFKEPDVGVYQVRSTCHQQGCLIVRENDSDAEKFILVIALPPVYRIVGMIQGADAKLQKFYRAADDRGVGCWWVPQESLAEI